MKIIKWKKYDKYLKGELLPDFTNNNTIIQTENIVLQLSTLEDQKNSNNQAISSIDLGDCEELLRDEYDDIPDNESLVIIKEDIISSDITSTFVQYEVFHPINKTKLDLNYICKDVNININIPVNLDDDTLQLFNSLNDKGHNLCNSEDSFYQDKCVPYINENGTVEVYDLIIYPILSSELPTNVLAAAGSCTIDETTNQPEIGRLLINKNIDFKKDNIYTY